MDKQGIFKKVLEVCANVCNVSKEDIVCGTRKEDVVTARALLVFWLDAAGFTVKSIMECCDVKNAYCVNSIKARQEELWCTRYAYHLLVAEVGRRLLDYAHSIGEDFDMWKPIKAMSRRTGKY